MREKRALSMVLSLALILGSVAGFGGQKANAAETAKKMVVYVAAEAEVASGAAVKIDKTAVQVTEGDTAEVAVKQVLDKNYKDDYDYSNGFLSSIGKVAGSTSEPWVYWGFKVNGAEPQNPATGWGFGIGDYPLQAHDEISLVYGSFDNMPKQCSCYDNDGKIPDGTAQASALENAKKQTELLAQKIYEVNFQNGAYVPGIEDTDSLYSVFSLVQAGFRADKFYDNVCSKIVSQLQTMKVQGKIYDESSKKEITFTSYEGNRYVLINYTKIALVLSSLGVDITNAGGVNLVEKITQKKLYDIANPTTFTREALILFVMNTSGAAWSTGDGYLTEKELVDNLLADVDKQIAVSTDLKSEWGSTLDSAAMAVQALAPYTAKNMAGVDREAVTQACTNVMRLLSHMQSNETGGYAGANDNAWTLGQSMITVGLLESGTNPLKDSEFIKNGKTLFDASAKYVDVANGKVDENLVGGQYAYQPDQLLRGLVSCVRRVDGKSLFDASNPEYKAKITLQIDNPQVPVPSIKLNKPVIKKLSSNKKKTLTVQFAKVDKAKKYVVEIATDKKFKKNVKKKTVQSAKKVTFKKLKAGKKYYVRVRAYNGKVKSAYSPIKSKKVKK